MNPDYMFRNLIRMFSCDEGFPRSDYSQWLDGTVSRIDGLREKEVISGQSFTPSTNFRFDDYQVHFLLLLMSCIGSEQQEGLTEQTAETLRHVTNAKGDDIRARRLQRWLEDSRRFLSDLSEEVWGGVLSEISYTDQVSFINRRDYVDGMLRIALEIIHRERSERLEKLVPSRERLLEFGKAISNQLVSTNVRPPLCWFRKVERVKDTLEPKEWHVTDYPKGRLTIPAMDYPTSNEIEYFSEQVVQRICSDLLANAINQSRSVNIRTTDAKSFFEAFIEKERRLLGAGYEPLLLVESRRRPQWISNWMQQVSETNPNPRPDNLRVFRDPQQTFPGYVATFNSTKVVAFPIELGAAFLLARELFDALYLTIIEENEGYPVGVGFSEQENSGLGKLIFKWSRKVSVNDIEINRMEYNCNEEM